MMYRTLVIVGLFAAFAVSIVGQYSLWSWYVEDAAISFAYSRNLADGWGLVRFPGEERVEGYSNPLWVLLMAIGERIGFNGFQSSKAMALALAGASLTAVWAAVRHAKGPWGWGVVAAFVLAFDAQFVIWSASGLENSLFCALLALGLWRTLAEGEKGGFPFAALCFLGLALTRPEGIAYAAVGGFWALVLEASGPRRWKRIALWLGLFWVPFAVYHAIRFQYFAFEFPATYYAKLGETKFRTWVWGARGWVYLRDYCAELGRLWFLPVFVAGVVGLKGWRALATAGLTIWLGFLLVFPGVEPFVSQDWWPQVAAPSWFVTMRIVSIHLFGIAVAVAGIGNKGWRVRILTWLFLLIGLTFAVRSTGDWMRGFRWLSLVAVPLAVIFALGCAEIVAWAGRWGDWGTRVAVAASLLITAAAIAPHVHYQQTYAPEVTPGSVDRRVQHYRWAKELLQLEHADIVDHDMGAMLYWGDDLGVVRDAKGLIDLPFALHGFDRAFVEEYLWKEHPFDLAHAHASTGSAVRRMGNRWRTQYIEFPGYGKRGLHTGNFVRKSIFVRPWEGSTERSAEFEQGVTLHGIEMISPEVSPGSSLFVEFGLQTDARSKPLRMLMVMKHLETGRLVVFDLPLGFDDWYPVTSWASDEVFVGQTAVRLGRDLPLGAYSVGVALFGPSGVIPVVGEPTGEPVFMAGEVHWPGTAVELVPRKKMGALARADADRALEAAEERRCFTAEAWWKKAKAHRIKSMEWRNSVRPRVATAIARCHAIRTQIGTHGEKVDSIRRARRWDPIDPEVLETGRVLGERWYQEGVARKEKGDPAAFDWFRDTLYADPSRSWARRYAEHIRAERLANPAEKPGRSRRKPPDRGDAEDGAER